MMNTSKSLLSILFLGLLMTGAGCSTEQEQQEAADRAAQMSDEQEAAVATDTSAGGQAVQRRRYTAPGDFPLAFSTLLPSGIRAQRIERSVGETVRFLAADQNQALGHPVVELHVYPQGMTVEEARHIVRDKAQGFGQVQEGNTYEWARAEYTFKGKQFAGRIGVGQHAGVVYYLMQAHPIGTSGEIQSQAQTIIDNWQWMERSGEPE